MFKFINFVSYISSCSKFRNQCVLVPTNINSFHLEHQSSKSITICTFTTIKDNLKCTKLVCLFTFNTIKTEILCQKI